MLFKLATQAIMDVNQVICDIKSYILFSKPGLVTNSRGHNVLSQRVHTMVSCLHNVLDQRVLLHNILVFKSFLLRYREC